MFLNFDAIKVRDGNLAERLFDFLAKGITYLEIFNHCVIAKKILIFFERTGGSINTTPLKSSGLCCAAKAKQTAPNECPIAHTGAVYCSSK